MLKKLLMLLCTTSALHCFAEEQEKQFLDINTISAEQNNNLTHFVFNKKQQDLAKTDRYDTEDADYIEDASLQGFMTAVSSAQIDNAIKYIRVSAEQETDQEQQMGTEQTFIPHQDLSTKYNFAISGAIGAPTQSTVKHNSCIKNPSKRRVTSIEATISDVVADKNDLAIELFLYNTKASFYYKQNYQMLSSLSGRALFANYYYRFGRFEEAQKEGFLSRALQHVFVGAGIGYAPENEIVSSMTYLPTGFSVATTKTTSKIAYQFVVGYWNYITPTLLLEAKLRYMILGKYKNCCSSKPAKFQNIALTIGVKKTL